MTEQQFSPSALQRGAVFRFGAPALAVAVFLGYAAAMLRDFEYDIGHFEPSSPAFYLCAVGCALAVLFAALPGAAAARLTFSRY